MNKIPVDVERTHLHAWEMLPWLVNGTLPEAERAQVEAHLAGCESCREELARQRGLFSQMNAKEIEGPSADQGVARLLLQIDERPRQAAPAASGARAPRNRWAAIAYGLAALLVLETGGVAVLSSQSDAGSHASAVYRTLSLPDSTASRATIRLVVDPAMTAGGLQALLVPLHLQIVAGPTENGVYSLGPAAKRGDVERQIGELRAASGVRFVEPVGASRDTQ
ncbi:hypothetical protein FAZ69_03310 [Trinickia terrae]|uniref:Putative zinc-finger domain-containing protein n=1 Tax=Trinickia terrae TaxID=2571161 RepID=A0A4U1ID10_9BURK|nr:zf-HC2 domain-containing protein [Trinickia terrae]TKC91499.1 hypothetical protein FAZ69_03310 [Trinickia terrae]